MHLRSSKAKVPLQQLATPERKRKPRLRLLKTFSLLRHLPPEIRCMIWDWAARQQRLVVAELRKDDDEEAEEETWSLACVNSRALAQSREFFALDYTSRKAHEQFRRSTRWVSMCNGTGYRSADPESDIFFIRKFDDYKSCCGIDLGRRCVRRTKWKLSCVMLGKNWGDYLPTKTTLKLFISPHGDLRELYLHEERRTGWRSASSHRIPAARLEQLTINMVRRRQVTKRNVAKQEIMARRWFTAAADLSQDPCSSFKLRVWLSWAKQAPRMGGGWPLAVDP